MTDYFECIPDCAKCCPGSGELIVVPLTLGDLFRKHYYGDKKSMLELYDAEKYCCSPIEKADAFYKDVNQFRNADISFVLPAVEDPCKALTAKKCSQYGQNTRPIHCYAIPEGVFLDYTAQFGARESQIFQCIKGKTLLDPKRAHRLESLSLAETGLSSLIFPMVRVGDSNVINMKDTDAGTVEHIQFGFIAQYYCNQHRRKIVLDFMRYTTNEFNKVLGVEEMIPDEYEDPIPDIDFSMFNREFGPAQHCMLDRLIKNFKHGYEKLKKD